MEPPIPQAPPPLAPSLTTIKTLAATATSNTKHKDFLLHLEAYLEILTALSRRCQQGPQDLRVCHDDHPPSYPKPYSIHRHLKSFESIVGMSRKALQQGKFV
ncbi:hypothetical protein NL676_000095 [Syzygium grande]|nr:hypothetical protein NL676_000095 [Syzygium grande]